MDNRYYNYGCPPLMNDGRFLSNYVRASVFDQFIRTSNNIETGHDFRHYLQNNGAEIMNNLKAHFRETSTCSVEGKCLPLSGSTLPEIKAQPLKNLWYEELLDNTNDLEFMMAYPENDSTADPTSNDKGLNDNVVKPVNSQSPETCKSCTR